MHVVYLCVGDEYKGSRHSHKAYNRGDKSSWLFPDLDFCYGCRLLHYNSVKLPEQGKAAFHLSLSLSLSLSETLAAATKYIPIHLIIKLFSGA
jgi:hypothetical protein